MIGKLLTALTGKAIAGVALGALVAGGAGAATYSLASSEGEVLEATEDTTTTTAEDDGTDDTTTTTAAETTTTTVADEETEDDEADDDAEEADGEKAHPENFGAVVSEMAKDGGNAGGVSDLAHAKNDARKDARAESSDDPDADEAKADDADDDDQGDDDSDDDDAAHGEGRQKGKGRK